MKLLKIVNTLIIGMFVIFTLCSCGDKEGKGTTEKQGFSDLFEDDVILKYDTDNDMYTEKITIDKLFSDDGVVDMTSFTYPAKYSYELTFKAKKDFTIKTISYDLLFSCDEENIAQTKERYMNYTSISFLQSGHIVSTNIKNAKIENVHEEFSTSIYCQIGDELSNRYNYNYEANYGKNAYKDSYVHEYFRFVGNSNDRTERVNLDYNKEIKKGEYLSIRFGSSNCSIHADITDMDNNDSYINEHLWNIDVNSTKLSNLTFEEE